MSRGWHAAKGPGLDLKADCCIEPCTMQSPAQLNKAKLAPAIINSNINIDPELYNRCATKVNTQSHDKLEKQQISEKYMDVYACCMNVNVGY